ncbi:hypothetical protein COCCADRAFT_40239 [Bipolaris zeicola 26-R-13]|uniref:RNA polymerase III RPC4-domain-containing protein n=1 Tax=Cochliobolus carbonum (strain 26-R-13) TaxID=930089 RepID=W6XPS8_COCC2|nr:uncharacterized protein COCCADRAFT_40239 [Bipolaris zeicola 26-R-13]EUC29377.1 hypothetical protein COCCADRAFT_40239 [Bipolaris zeicola 26-R-13]
MPPKPRGSGTTRSRGGARGGSVVARNSTDATESVQDATPQSTAPAAATGDSIEPVIPKEEDTDSKPVVTEEGALNATESKASSSATASAAESPQPGAEPSARAPVQRLGSLQGSVPPSRSASPSVRGRGGTARGKRGVKTPAFTGRRSKEERDAIAKEQAARDRERTKEQVAADKKREADALRAARREANKQKNARGGFSGVASGPFSLGSSREDRKNNPNRGHSGFGAGSGSRAERIKNEDGGYAGSSRSGGGSGGGGSSYMKREDGGMVSSDDEDDINLPRKDIDLIEISSDEDEAKDKSVPTQRPTRTALPVRIGRKEHQERTFGINTEASSEASAKILEQAESSGQSLATAATDQAGRRSKAKSKDVEITGSRKQFKGVWNDPEDSDIAVKTEPTSDDENMADAEQVGLSNAPAQPAEKEEPQSPDAERKPKIKRKSIAEPILQTDEDRAEWARFQSNLRHIRAELGPEEVPSVDGTGDVAMADAGSAEKRPTVRDNNVYLFQIPPLMPEVEPLSVKKEASDAQPPPPPVQASGKADAKIKVEEGSFSDPNAKAKEGVRFGSGLVGKLRVHKSGRTTLDWGGTSFELTPGNRSSFLQEVASVEIRPENQRAAPEDAGDAISLGRVKGKFVVVPNWAKMLD